MTAIRLLVSDVDGTLVTHDKVLTDATRAAIDRLRAAGIGFTIVSSRPPIGLRHVVDDLRLDLPVGGFNGGSIVQPDGAVVDQTLIPEAAARRAAAYLAEQGVTVWVFADDRWIITDPDGDYVERERHTIRSEPLILPEFGDRLARAGKIVGACLDTGKLAVCEEALRDRLGTDAVAARSQPYYLDVTPPGVDKGTFVRALSERLGIPTAAIAAVGDMDNDIPMLDAAGLSIAMGNAEAAVKARADHVTRGNEEDGVAWAIDHLILGQGRA